MSAGGPLGIAGVGLIGGSIALRARRGGRRTIGFDPDPDARALVDATASSLPELASLCDTLVLALPVDGVLAAVDELRTISGLRPVLVLDVASVKAPVAARAQGWDRFVATHPIAGSEGSGPAAARADLFEGRAWAYVPTGDSRDQAVRAFVAAMGAEAFPIDAELHDRAIALTSHLPQVVASTLGALLAEAGPPPKLAGPGLASSLRLAGSPWPLWETIVRANAASLAGPLRELGSRLSSLASELEAGDLTRLASYFDDARESYETFVRHPRT